MLSSEAKRQVQENGQKLLGPGRFAKASISSRDWIQTMLRDPVTEEERAWMDKQDKEDQMNASSEESEDGVTDDGMKDVLELLPPSYRLILHRINVGNDFLFPLMLELIPCFHRHWFGCPAMYGKHVFPLQLFFINTSLLTSLIFEMGPRSQVEESFRVFVVVQIEGSKEWQGVRDF